jgi:hypothetical protein
LQRTFMLQVPYSEIPFFGISKLHPNGSRSDSTTFASVGFVIGMSSIRTIDARPFMAFMRMAPEGVRLSAMVLPSRQVAARIDVNIVGASYFFVRDIGAGGRVGVRTGDMCGI